MSIFSGLIKAVTFPLTTLDVVADVATGGDGSEKSRLDGPFLGTAVAKALKDLAEDK